MGEAAVVKSACALLRQLANSDEVKEAVTQAGALDLLNRAVAIHSASPATLEQVIPPLVSVALLCPPLSTLFAPLSTLFALLLKLFAPPLTCSSSIFSSPRSFPRTHALTHARARSSTRARTRSWSSCQDAELLRLSWTLSPRNKGPAPLKLMCTAGGSGSGGTGGTHAEEPGGWACGCGGRLH